MQQRECEVFCLSNQRLGLYFWVLTNADSPLPVSYQGGLVKDILQPSKDGRTPKSICGRAWSCFVPPPQGYGRVGYRQHVHGRAGT
jgi:hypothetical protein